MEERLYRALDEDGPLSGILLVRDYDISPSFAFTKLRKMQSEGFAATCDPPEDRKGQTVDSAWFCLTLKGQEYMKQTYSFPERQGATG